MLPHRGSQRLAAIQHIQPRRREVRCDIAAAIWTGPARDRGLLRQAILADRTGYVRQFYGARAPGRGGLALTVTAGGDLTGLTITMTPQEIISGTVEDARRDLGPASRWRRWKPTPLGTTRRRSAIFLRS